MSAEPVASSVSAGPTLTHSDTVDTVISEDSVVIKTRQGHTTVLQRLVGLFPVASPSFSPHQSSASRSANPDSTPGAEPTAPKKTGVRWDSSVPATPPSRKPPVINHKALKVRMVTWNMHDSLPKGELEELLGKVPVYDGPTAPPGTFPYLPPEADHPYHFVVVAGQECPSSSGLPMALGAGIKQLILERDREKEKEREKDKGHGEKSPKDVVDRKPEVEELLEVRLKELESEMNDPSVKAKRSTEPPDGRPVGWTSIVADWLCNAGTFGLLRAKSHKISSTLDVATRPLAKRANSMKDPTSLKKTGPYQLLVKERLLGIYLAIYIHRDLKPFVKGVSKSAVTAGLIGGRVGNKGGVGISINLDGTTLLFLNAHLAAHEGRISHRLANLEKIKMELEVDDFLPEDHPRKRVGDLTDRFDFTFLCGDLNFRLDITRLHADWLIARQDYEQALTFDQLLKLMKNNAPELAGFKEADINFPPTFKYDVLRTLKRPKLPDHDDDNDDSDGERMSVSSMSTAYSRATELDINQTALPSPTTPTIPVSASKVSLHGVVSANKAKLKLLSLNSPLFKRKKAPFEGGEPATPTSAFEPGFSPLPVTPRTAADPLCSADSSPFLLPPPKIRVESMTSNTTNASHDEGGAERGVYDTSSKKRVPSWCDRILWKSTVEPAVLTPEITPDKQDQTHSREAPRLAKRKFSKFLSPFRKGSKTAREVSEYPHDRTSIDSLPPYIPPLKSAPPLSQGIFPPNLSQFTSPTTTDTPLMEVSSLPQPPVSASAVHRKRAISATHPSPSGAAPLSGPRRSTFGVLISPLSGSESAAPSRWRFLPNFFSPNSAQPPTVEIEEPVTPVETPAIVRRKGDVVCLDYNTLDDRRMRRLEGRSDHRPVLGTFMVYI